MDQRARFLYEGFLKEMPFKPTPCQDALLAKAAALCTGDEQGDTLIVDGYAGTGKTTAMGAVVRFLKSLKVPVMLLSPTGRSAKVLSSYTDSPAYTIHKQIYRQKSLGGAFTLGFNPCRNTLFVVDEVSLIGVGTPEGGTVFGTGNLLRDLLEYVRSNTGNRLILLGDSAQLPPVGHTQSPALDRGYMARFGGVSWATLTTVVRQAEQSGILRNATRLREFITDPMFQDMGPGEVGLTTRGFEDFRSISGAELIDTLYEEYRNWGEDDTIVLCRSNKRALVYNLGIRSRVFYHEDSLVRGENLMIVRNCYHFTSDRPPQGRAGAGEDYSRIGYIANGDIAKLVRISHFEQRYGLSFAQAVLSFPDYDGEEVTGEVCLDTLTSASASLSPQQQDALFRGVSEDYADIEDTGRRVKAIREDPFLNALQLKYANAITAHKSQGGQWSCVFVDNPFWEEGVTLEDLKWLYTAITRGVRRVYLVNFKEEFFA